MLSLRKLFVSAIVSTLCVTSYAFAGQAAPAAPAKDTKAAKAAPAGPVDINSASEADLVALPGVGPATAKKIIAGRPYTAVADLAKAGVPKATIDKITPMVKVGPAAAGTPPPPPPPAAAKSTTPATTSAAPTSAAPAAGAQQPPVKGMVWVNLNTKVFHREGDRYYGNTKNGKFMTEEDAVKAGYREAKMGAAKKKTGTD
jgi:Helix-hairpin-helix motif